MDLNELTALIKSRRSIRAWQNKPVAEELLLQAIETATYAPNGGNQQNWRFYVVLKREIIDSIAKAVQASNDLVATWPEASGNYREMVSGMVRRASFFKNAPAIILVAASKYQSPLDQLLELREKSDPQAGEMHEWRNTANSKVQSVASAIACLLLVLHQMGLGAVWMTGPLQAKADLEKILKVPAGLDLLAMIPVGYPAEAPPLKERKPVSQVTEVIK